MSAISKAIAVSGCPITPENHRCTMNILIGIPAYNEEATIGAVIAKTKEALPNHDLVVVNDGSTDRTAEIVRHSPARLVSLPCNLGYSSAVETIIKYAFQHQYDAVVLIDADGQHDPASLPGFLAAFEARGCDVLIGSRYAESRNYRDSPIGRRIGMLLFSQLTAWLAGKRIYDTTSGMKGIKRCVMPTLLGWQFVDFHSEAIIYLLWSGYSVEEYPITVGRREHGTSMYSLMSSIWYPLTVILMIMVSFVQSKVRSRGKK
jgi:glycosyltransferase involved in cell wall biosynthesis